MVYLYGSLVFCIGIYLGLYGQDNNIQVPVSVLVVVLLICLSGVLYALRTSKTQLLIILIVAVLSLIGFGVGAATQTVSKAYEPYYEQEIELEGDVKPGSVKVDEQGGVNLLLAVKRRELNGARQATDGILRLYVNGLEKTSPLLVNGYGQVTVWGKIKPIRGMKNPGVYDAEKAASINNIIGRMSVKSNNIHYLKTAKPWLSYFADINTTVRKIIASRMPSKDSAVLIGMTIGGYEGIEEATVSDFATTGIVHILSVSGSHVALLAGFILTVMKFIPCRKSYTLMLAALTILLYGTLCGFSPPVLRSVLMGLAMLSGMYLERETNRGAIFALVIILMLCYQPRWLLDIGFVLSFASTAGLVFLLKPIHNVLTKIFPNWLAEGVGVTLTAQLAAGPFIIYYFHQLSLSSIVANLVIVPILEFLVLVTLMALLVYAALPALGNILLMLASCILAPTMLLNRYLAALPYSVVTIPHSSVFSGILYYLGLLNLFAFTPWSYLSKNNRRLLTGILLLVSILTCIVIKCMPQPLTVYFIDVGQGDAALVITPERKTILIDSGGLRNNFNVGERILLPFFHYLGVEKLDLLLLSHGHHDHAGGAAAIAKKMPIDRVVLAHEEPSEDVWKLVNQLHDKSNIYYAAPGQSYRVGACEINIIAAPTTTVADTNKGGNESSIICKVRSDQYGLIFTGDATAEEETTAALQNIQAAVLKVSHHGSKTSSEEVFLQAIQPQLAVISVGYGNSFGHPAEETLWKLKNNGAKILRTDNLGNIKIVFDDNNCTWYSYRYQENCF